MNAQRSMVLVEDTSWAYRAFKNDLEEKGWEVFRACDREDAFYQILKVKDQGKKIEAIAVDLGFPPDKEDPFKAGIPLIEELRPMFPTLPILAYTALTSTHFRYEEAVRRLLRMRASFLYTRQLGERFDFSQIIEWTWLGYVIISPEVSDKLHYAILHRPDPLTERHWRLLRLLCQGLSQKEIVSELDEINSIASVKGWKNDIRHILEDLNEIDQVEEAEKSDSDLINWYLTHRIRYCRD
jgi:DNA-binding NarL/FixJ family response regulator